MPASLQITLRDMPNSEALDTHIRDKVKKLDGLFAHVISCRVVVDMPHRHQQQGKEFSVRIDLGVPGNEIVVNRRHNEDPYVALRDAFDAARRKLEDYVHRMRRETKTHAMEFIGNVARISHKEGFGFIAGADGTERYFHRDNVVNPSFDKLKEGDEVKFVEEMAADGLQARRVSMGKHHLPQ
ncbi:MAG: HPF/RaiA family ribosome-associated protein [Methylophilaceae bacterium]|jgi:ribosomal subunit interface protein